MAAAEQTSVAFSGRSMSEVAWDCGVSRRWVRTRVSRYLAGGWDAFEFRSRRRKSDPRRIGPSGVDEIVRLRRLLTEQGLDAGAKFLVCNGFSMGVRRPTFTDEAPLLQLVLPGSSLALVVSADTDFALLLRKEKVRGSVPLSSTNAPAR